MSTREKDAYTRGKESDKKFPTTVPKREDRETDRTKVYDIVVVFGDTNLDLSRERARKACDHKANIYLLVGTQREQDAMRGEMKERKKYVPGIVAGSPPSSDTKQNVATLKTIAAPFLNLKDTMEANSDKASAEVMFQILVVSHESHADRLRTRYLNGMAGVIVDYDEIQDDARRKIEHGILKHTRDRTLNSNLVDWIAKRVANTRESVKSKVEH
ncbi:MAG: hypothetical protein KGH66_01570 [Candidatus Micrarchaeota archaeon]|nr:hypothetical protein [Candidatus Micrarchaeota archaeon]